MYKTILIIGAIAIFMISSCTTKKEKVVYPTTAKVDSVDNYFGTKVADPYRWLEDDNSAQTKEWVIAENELTDEYLNKISFKEKLKNRLTKLWNYEKYSAPQKVADFYIFSKNDGLQEHSVIYIQAGLDAEAEVLLDPNKFSEDGSVSLDDISFSKDGKYASYSISRGGSDWREIYVMSVNTKELLSDHLMWAKFTSMAWYKDGFYYGRYEEPKEENKLKAKNEFQKLYYHKLGTLQPEDKIILEDKTNPQLGFSAQVTDDEKYLLIYGWQGSASENSLYFKDLQKDSKIKNVFDKFDAQYGVVDNVDDKLLVTTNNNAPQSKLILVDPNKPAQSNWEEIIPETENTLQSVSFVGGKLIADYLKDANSYVTVHSLSGEKLYNIELPGVGSVYGFGGK